MTIETAMVLALAEIDRELGLPEDGCNSTARTLSAIRLLHCAHRDDTAEIVRLRGALVAVRTSLHCTKLAPHEYDADHYCNQCGHSTAHEKDIIDEALVATHDLGETHAAP